MSEILVTGGAGFVGSHLVDGLREHGHEVTVIDNLSTGRNEATIKADVNNYQDIAPIFNRGFDYVYHYAAVVGVQRTLQNPVAVLKDIDGIKNILDLSKNTGVKRVFFSSSSEVYGEPVEIPQHEETTPLNSRLPYAVVKNVGETMLRAYKQEYELDFTIFRFFNTYGPRQSTDFVMSKFIDLAKRNEPIPVYGEGDQTRTFCYVADNIEATRNALENEDIVNATINIGNDEPIQIIDLARKIIELGGSSSEIVHLPALPEGDMTRRQPDVTKMKALLGRDFISLDEGIRRVLRG